MLHPHSERLSAWIEGALPASEADAIEAHVDQCEACASRLSALALQEQDFFAVADASRHAPPARSAIWPRVTAAAAVAVAIAAVALGAVLLPRPHQPPTAAVPTEDLTPDCSSHADMEQCAAEARQRGLWIPDGPVPSYEPDVACLDCGRDG